MANYTIQYWDGDDVDLEYDDAKHTYMVGERKVPSVTRVVDAVFPKYLVDWAAQAGANWWHNRPWSCGRMQLRSEGIWSAFCHANEDGQTALSRGSCDQGKCRYL